MLELILNNVMIQWVKNLTRYRGEDETSRFFLTFTKRVDRERYVSYMCPIAKSDHVIMEMEVIGEREGIQGKNIKKTEGIIEG